MLSYPVILSVAMAGVAVLAILVFVISGSYAAVLIVLACLVALGFVLNSFGVVSVKRGKDGLEVDFHENAPAPNEKRSTSINIKEVFHISGNNYNYNEAPAVCAAYGAELASQDQITEAFSLGAEWCGYGWSAGGMALYPTQESTWSALQGETDESRRTACGRPGVNGGYFDPLTKFGVNCYGIKPQNKGTKLPIPLPGEDTSGFEKEVKKFKRLLESMKLSPFNRDIWSAKGAAGDMLKKSKSGLEGDIQALEKDIGL